jgi:hypothetical protein
MLVSMDVHVSLVVMANVQEEVGCILWLEKLKFIKVSKSKAIPTGRGGL